MGMYRLPGIFYHDLGGWVSVVVGEKAGMGVMGMGGGGGGGI